MSEILEKAKLSLGSDKFLTVDVGIHGMKVLEVKKKGLNYVIKNAFTIPEMSKHFNGLDMFNVNGIAESLSQILELEKIKSKKIILSFSSSKLQSKVISIPEIPEKQLRTFVELEYQKQFSNINKITDAIDYMPIGNYTKEGTTQNQISILMSLFPASEAARVIKDFQNKKFFVDTLDVDTHALGNIGKLYNSDEERDIAVLDIGYETSQIVFLRNDSVVFSRNIAFGVHSIIRSIQSQADMSLKDSESILETQGLRIHDDITKGSQTIYSDDYNEAVEGAITNALNEAYRSFQFVNTNFGLNISNVLLTGGFSALNYAKEICQKILELEVDTWNLEHNESINLPNGTKFTNQTGKKLESSYAIALGMAIRGSF